MSALTGQSISPRMPETTTATVKNDGWWPDINMERLRDAVLLPSGVTDKRLVHHTRRVVLSVNNELAAWKMERKGEGYTKPEDIPIEDAEGNAPDEAYDEHPLITHYLGAIYSAVDARLCEQYRKTDSTGKGEKNAQMLDPRVAEGFRDKDWEVSAILNFNVPAHTKTTIALI